MRIRFSVCHHSIREFHSDVSRLSPETKPVLIFFTLLFVAYDSGPSCAPVDSEQAWAEQLGGELGGQEDEEEEEEEEGEDVYVLTDEWAEFFAKSEAKRQLGRHHLFPLFFFHFFFVNRTAITIHSTFLFRLMNREKAEEEAE